MTGKRTASFWVILIVGLIWGVWLILGQTMSFINYDFTVSISMQESKDIIGEMGVAINKGFGVADTLIYLPLWLAGLVGLWRKKAWGLFLMAAAFGITAYFPVVCLFWLLFARGITDFRFTNFTTYTILLTIFTLYGLWGLWYLCKHRKELTDTTHG